MMGKIKIFRLLLILLAFLYCGSTAAAPRVSITLPPLHSLVSALMQGVAEPALLLPPDMASNTAMDPFQKGQMITSGLAVWVGAGLETPVAKTLQAMPVLEQKMPTLSREET